MECPYCGGSAYYLGIDDGLGDYGDCVGDVWVCESCDIEFEGALRRMPDLDEREQIVEQLFDQQFPPGSDGPDVGFDIASLYQQAEEMLRARAETPDPDDPET